MKLCSLYSALMGTLRAREAARPHRLLMLGEKTSGSGETADSSCITAGLFVVAALEGGREAGDGHELEAFVVIEHRPRIVDEPLRVVPRAPHQGRVHLVDPRPHKRHARIVAPGGEVAKVLPVALPDGADKVDRLALCAVRRGRRQIGRLRLDLGRSQGRGPRRHKGGRLVERAGARARRPVAALADQRRRAGHVVGAVEVRPIAVWPADDPLHHAAGPHRRREPRRHELVEDVGRVRVDGQVGQRTVARPGHVLWRGEDERAAQNRSLARVSGAVVPLVPQQLAERASVGQRVSPGPAQVARLG
eukprot:scaffold1198_cov116-Isochrysis_galbana.AAC.7